MLLAWSPGGSSDKMEVPSVSANILQLSSSNRIHPVTKKPVPSTAIVRKDVVIVSTQSSATQANNNSTADFVCLQDTDSSMSSTTVSTADHSPVPSATVSDDDNSGTSTPRSYMTSKKKREMKTREALR